MIYHGWAIELFYLNLPTFVLQVLLLSEGKELPEKSDSFNLNS